MFSNIYIYGIGMMGGSLAKSIKQKNLAKKIYGFDINHDNLIFAKKKKIIDDYDNNFKYLKNADLIIICAPVSKYKSIFKNISKNKKEGAIITDIGSTKVDIIKEYNKAFNKNSTCFIGSHPLTGKESSSVQNSDPNLFNKAVILVTPEDENDKVLVKTILSFWKKLGCNTFVISPIQHDLVLSETSHLPHLVSFALVNIIQNTTSIENIEDYTGGGFRDFARLAHSDSSMWKDICFSNKKNIINSINLLKKELDHIKILINKKDHRLGRYLKNIKMKLEKHDK